MSTTETKKPSILETMYQKACGIVNHYLPTPKDKQTAGITALFVLAAKPRSVIGTAYQAAKGYVVAKLVTSDATELARMADTAKTVGHNLLKKTQKLVQDYGKPPTARELIHQAISSSSYTLRRANGPEAQLDASKRNIKRLKQQINTITKYRTTCRPLMTKFRQKIETALQKGNQQLADVLWKQSRDFLQPHTTLRDEFTASYRELITTFTNSFISADERRVIKDFLVQNKAELLAVLPNAFHSDLEGYTTTPTMTVNPWNNSTSDGESDDDNASVQSNDSSEETADAALDGALDGTGVVAPGNPFGIKTVRLGSQVYTATNPYGRTVVTQPDNDNPSVQSQDSKKEAIQDVLVTPNDSDDLSIFNSNSRHYDSNTDFATFELE